MDWTACSQIYETLVVRGRLGQLQPGLALRWERTDPETWQFYLRPGARFHDGSPCDAFAVAQSLARAAGLRTSGQPVEFAAIHPYREFVELTTRTPFSPLPEYLAYLNFAITKAAKGAAPLGTGAFRFVSYQREREFVVESAYRRVRFRCIPDSATRLLSLEAGEIDAMRAVPPAELVRPQTAVRFLPGPGRHTHYLGFNRSAGVWREEFADIRVRRAFDLALDRQALVQGPLHGTAIPASSPVPPWRPFRRDAAQASYDPAAALHLFAEAGWHRDPASGWLKKNGKICRVNYVFAPAWLPQNTLMAEWIQASLHRVGVAVELHPLDWSAARAAERSGFAHLRHRGLTWAVGGTHFGLYTGFHSQLTGLASIHHPNAAIDAGFDRWNHAASAGEQESAAASIQATIAHEVPFLPLYYERETVAVHPRFLEPARFFAPHPDTYPQTLATTT